WESGPSSVETQAAGRQGGVHEFDTGPEEMTRPLHRPVVLEMKDKLATGSTEPAVDIRAIPHTVVPDDPVDVEPADLAPLGQRTAVIAHDQLVVIDVDVSAERLQRPLQGLDPVVRDDDDRDQGLHVGP